MKKEMLFLMLVGVISFASCTKSHLCSCYVSDNVSGIGSVVDISVKTKNDAKSIQHACEQESKTRTNQNQLWECSLK